VAAAKAVMAARGPNRGGSPRDMVRYAMRNGNFGQDMANQALGYRGMPYIRGAESPNRGFDCSGLVYYLLTRRGYKPPRTASGFASYGKPVANGDLKPGDIVLFANTYHRGVSHVGVYVGNGNFLHAANSSKGVIVSALSEKYYRGKFYGARRVQ
jgi:cell wall-associated NlpC family hydrolase